MGDARDNLQLDVPKAFPPLSYGLLVIWNSHPILVGRACPANVQADSQEQTFNGSTGI